MKTFLYTLTTIIAFGCISIEAGFSQEWLSNVPAGQRDDFRALQKAFNDYWSNREIEKGKGWKQFKRWEYFWEQRLRGKWEFPTAEYLQKTYETAFTKHKAAEIQGLGADWKEIGPSTVPTNMLSYKSSGIGRINCIRFHPTNQNVVWAGSSSGGLWRSGDGGKSWELFPIAGVWSPGISDIAIASSNANVMYVATGDADGAFMSRSYSVGVYKSTDAGKTWSPTKLLHSMSSAVLTGCLAISPYSANTVFAGTSAGLYKTDDGGMNWKEVISGAYIRQVKIKIGDPGVMLAATSSDYYGGGRILKSTNAGNTWTDVLKITDGSRIVIGQTMAKPNYVYAAVANAKTNGFSGLYRSTDFGNNWDLMASSPNILGLEIDGNSEGGQANYDLAITVNPKDADQVYVGGIHMWKSTNGGKNWKAINHWTGDNLPYVHADQHDLQFTNDGMLYSANDGGIYISSDLGAKWTDISNGLNIQQYYKCNTSNSTRNIFIGGTQDNGTMMCRDGKWYHVMGGDGMDCGIDPKDPNIIYASYYNGFFSKSVDGGNNFSPMIYRNITGEIGAWVTPFLIDPNKNTTLYAGYMNVWRSTDQGNGWKKLGTLPSTSLISSIAVAPGNSGIIYVSSANCVYRTEDTGKTWKTIFSGSGTVTSIEPDYNSPLNCWITMSGYSDVNRVLKYTNSGNTWTDISSGLPAMPANKIIMQANSPEGNLFVATDVGVYYKNSEMSSWAPFSNGMPYVFVSDLKINYATGRLIASTFGRGAWETKILNCNIAKPTIQSSGSLAFCSGDSVVLSVDGNYSSIEWNNGAKGKSVIVRSSGTYYAIVKDQSGCLESSDPVNVVVYTAPDMKIWAVGKNYGCSGDSVVLTTSIGYVRYNWSNGDTTRRISVRAPGDYFVSGFTSKGCYGEADTSFNVKYYERSAKPSVSFTGDSLVTGEGNAYQWYFEGKEIPDATRRSFKPVKSGLYQVGVASNTPCMGLSDAFSFVNSVEEPQDGVKIEISPNPSGGNVELKAEIGRASSVEILITDIGGREVHREAIPVPDGAIDKTLNLEKLDSGIYFIGIKVGNEYYVRKMAIY